MSVVNSWIYKPMFLLNFLFIFLQFSFSCAFFPKLFYLVFFILKLAISLKNSRKNKVNDDFAFSLVRMNINDFKNLKLK